MRHVVVYKSLQNTIRVQTTNNHATIITTVPPASK